MTWRVRFWWAQWAVDKTPSLLWALKPVGYKEMLRVPEGTAKGQVIVKERENSSWLKPLRERDS